MEPVQLYLAFPDGVLDHVCAECTALCCRGQGFAGSLRREMTALLRLHPALESAAVERQGDVVTFATPGGRCFFLDDDQLCRIEKRHGKALKPGVCVVFPFNRLARLGTTVTVSPHFMCPLRVRLPARPGAVEGTHAQVDAAVRTSGLLDAGYLRHAVRDLRVPSRELVDSVLAREVAFRDRCSDSLDTRSFAETLRQASVDASAMALAVGRAATVMGLASGPAGPTHAASDDIDHVLLAAASAYRLDMLWLGAEGLLRALSLAELVVRRVMSLSVAPPALDRVSRILTSVGPAIRLLAHGDEPLGDAERAGDTVPAFDDPDLALSSFIALRALRQSCGVLSALEKAIPQPMRASDRSALLTRIGRFVENAAARAVDGT